MSCITITYYTLALRTVRIVFPKAMEYCLSYYSEDKSINVTETTTMLSPIKLVLQ